jgi:lysophospholipase L1-like esterase
MGYRLLPPLAAFLLLAASLLGREPTDAQESAAPVYLALGDSLAFGVGADSPEGDGYVGLAAQALREGETFSRGGLDVLNLSQPGAETPDLVAPGGQLEQAVDLIENRAQDGILGNEVAIISISAGANDLLALAESGSPCIENAGSESCRLGLTATLTNVQNNLTEVLRQLRDAVVESETALIADIFVIDLYNPYSGSGSDFEIIASVGVQQLNGVIGVSVRANEVHLVRVFDLFQGRANQWISQDEIHPNNDGYRVIAEALLAAIERRPVSIPEDLRALPTEAPVVTTIERDGIRPLLFWILLPVVFVAGAVLSAAYFVMRRG